MTSSLFGAPCLFMVGVLVLALGCDESPVDHAPTTSSPSDTSRDETQAVPDNPIDYAYSENAAKVRRLISEGSYDIDGAAETLLDAYLPATPDDAGLYIQYARLITLSRDFSGDIYKKLNGIPIITIPGLNKGWTDVDGAVADLLKLAVQFDPKCAAHAADEVMASVYQRAKKHHDLDGGITPASSGSCYTDAALIAYHRDASNGKRWALEFEKLKPAAIRSGKPFSTFRLSLVTARLNGLNTVEQFRAVNADVVQAIRGYDNPDAAQQLNRLYKRYFPDPNEKDDPTFGQIALLWSKKAE